MARLFRLDASSVKIRLRRYLIYKLIKSLDDKRTFILLERLLSGDYAILAQNSFFLTPTEETKNFVLLDYAVIIYISLLCGGFIRFIYYQNLVESVNFITYALYWMLGFYSFLKITVIFRKE